MPRDVGADIVGDRVLDTKGQELGFVRGIDPGNGMLDVELSPDAAHRLGATAAFLRVPLDEIQRAEGHEVTLRDEGERLVRRDQKPGDMG